MTCALKCLGWFGLAIVIVAVSLLVPGPAIAAISFSGDYSPTDSANSGANWDSSTNGYVGMFASGSMTITSGGIDDLAAANGFLGYDYGVTGAGTVNGAGATWTIDNQLYVGFSGIGTLEIAGSGSVVNYGGASIAYDEGSQGTVTVSGSGSTWSCETEMLTVGGYGLGMLEILGGGNVVSGNSYVGRWEGSGGEAIVSGAGSTWTANGDLTVGNSYSDAIMSISSGGLVAVDGTTYVGRSEGDGPDTIYFNGGTLTTKSLYASPASDYSALSGTGTIQTRGLVSDVDLTFNSGKTQTIPLTGDDQNINLTLNMENSADVGDLGAGWWGNGSLTITNGVAITSETGYIGYNGGSAGTVTVEGADSKWTTKGSLYVGYNGDGTLEIANGGAVDVPDFTYVGVFGGSGTIAFGSGGGTLTTHNLYATQGQFLGAGQIDAHGIIRDADLTFDNSNQISLTLGTSVSLNLNMGDSNNAGDLAVGVTDNRSLMVRNGATIYSHTAILGYDYTASGTATVTGTGTKWVNLGDMHVGEGGAATLNIVNGGVLETDNCYIGNQTSGSGVITVDGSGSTWTSTGIVQLGASRGTGTLNVSNGGAVVAGLAIITGSRGSGTLNLLSGGTVVANALVGANRYSSVVNYNFDGGMLKAYELDNPTWIQPGMAGNTAIFVQAGGAKFDTNGHYMGIAMALQHSGGTDTDGGVTKLGAGALTLSGENTYDGLTTVKAGTLTLVGLDVGTASAWDPVLNDGGVDVQGGKLVFNYAGGTSPADTIATIMDDSFGTGSEVPFAQGNGAQIYSTTADAAGMALGWMDDGVDEVTVMYTLYGDSNLDGSVNGTDLNAVLSYYNKSAEVWNHGDFNYDGSVNGTDLNTVLSNYNQSLPSSTAAVPEPSTLLLMVLGLVGLLAWRRRM